MVRLVLVVVFLLTLTGRLQQVYAADPSLDTATLRAMIQEMKRAPRGPFSRIRWFCKDGTVLPPRPYACSKHGGGAQHGEWSEQTKQLRAAGYMIANILAGLDVETFVAHPDLQSMYNQMLIEQFLIAFDDGWILRRARFYRGALQAEGEAQGGRRLLLALVDKPRWLRHNFVPLRLGAYFLPHGRETSLVQDIREHSAALSNKDPGFVSIRNKIHVKPDQSDAVRVREYAAKHSNRALAAEFERLASKIDAMYSGTSAVQTLQALAKQLTGHESLARLVQSAATTLASGQDPVKQAAISGQLMARLRDALPTLTGSGLRLMALDANLVLEAEHFVAATRLRDRLENATRSERLQWLQASISALYGAGLISARQRQELRHTFERLGADQVALRIYKTELDYLGRVPGWGSQWLRFHFYETMRHFAALDPLADLFIQDQLRGSPLFFYAGVLDSLLRDANQLAGIRHQLFGRDIGTGLRGLNPGLARGVLRQAPEPGKAFDADGIYLLPETTAELPPVAGILTAGEGNPLSHVQLLARNLGIPNVGVDAALLPQLTAHQGSRVILAVSPAGSVLLAEDRGQWDHDLGLEDRPQEILIRPDLEKLDLAYRTLTPTSRLRATDSGRIVGPKAAKHGELRHHFPEAVAEGLTIPFGVFRDLLAKPLDRSGQDVFSWMVQGYAAIARLAPGSRARSEATERLRARLQSWILQADPGEAFWRRLRETMRRLFGPDGSYGVFVRSDTNVEDLPGFTGAGLNLTVPHVVGFEQVAKAILRVWASPFSRRAYAWRQAHMEHPEHVYPAVLLMLSVPVEKSGVMVTQDIDTGASGWLSIAVNEGVGGAVDGQAAESLRVHLESGQVRLLAQATAPFRRVLLPQGGVAKRPPSDSERVLSDQEIAQLITLARELPKRFPPIRDAAGKIAPADIEFGFLNGALKLFQIRPFLESRRARSSTFLQQLDGKMHEQLDRLVSMRATPQQ